MASSSTEAKCREIESDETTRWTSSKHFMDAICQKFRMDLENDKVCKLFWKIQLDKKVVITNERLEFVDDFEQRKFLKALQMNPQVKIIQGIDENNPARKLLKLVPFDFEVLLF